MCKDIRHLAQSKTLPLPTLSNLQRDFTCLCKIEIRYQLFRLGNGIKQCEENENTLRHLITSRTGMGDSCKYLTWPPTPISSEPLIAWHLRTLGSRPHMGNTKFRLVAVTRWLKKSSATEPRYLYTGHLLNTSRPHADSSVQHLCLIQNRSLMNFRNSRSI